MGYNDVPGLAKCNGDARSNERFDGLTYERYAALREIASKLELPEWLALLNFARELERGGESARTIGLEGALAEVDEVIRASQGKHPQQKWRTYSAKTHQGKLLGHVGKFLIGERNDQDTKRHHLAHMAARALMMLAIVLEEDKRR